MTLEQAAREVIESWDGSMTAGVLRGTLERLREALEALDTKLASEGPENGSQGVTAVIPGGATCAYCGIRRINCQAGGRYYNLCPLNPGQAGIVCHAWLVPLEGETDD